MTGGNRPRAAIPKNKVEEIRLAELSGGKAYLTRSARSRSIFSEKQIAVIRRIVGKLRRAAAKAAA